MTIELFMSLLILIVLIVDTVLHIKIAIELNRLRYNCAIDGHLWRYATEKNGRLRRICSKCHTLEAQGNIDRHIWFKSAGVTLKYRNNLSRLARYWSKNPNSPRKLY